MKLTTTADAGWVMGPSSSTTLNAIFRYGVGQLNNADSSIAGGMRVEVVAVPEPTAYALALAGLACGGFSMFRRVPPADPDLTPTSQRDSSARGKLSATKRGQFAMLTDEELA